MGLKKNKLLLVILFSSLNLAQSAMAAQAEVCVSFYDNQSRLNYALRIDRTDQGEFAKLAVVTFWKKFITRIDSVIGEKLFVNRQALPNAPDSLIYTIQFRDYSLVLDFESQQGTSIKTTLSQPRPNELGELSITDDALGKVRIDSVGFCK